MIATESDSTYSLTRVTAFVPASFDRENEDDYEALEDALGPWGGQKEAIEIERLDATTIIATYERA